MKYIINTGCSYGVMFRSMKEFTKGTEVDFKVIDLHADSFGAEFQKRSVIYTISNLFSRGIKPEDIFVITEWSQPNRLFIELPQEFSSEVFENKDFLEPNFVLDNTFNKIENSDLEFIFKYKSLNIVMGDRVYANIEHADLDSFDNPNIKFYIKEFIKNSPINNKPIDRLESYLTAILDLQNFLNAYKIDYSFFLMNNTFEGYYDNFAHFSSTEDALSMVQKDEIVLQNLKDFNQIKDFSSYLNKIWNLINLKNFVFYKTKNFDFGGIDEYAMENFGHISYTAGANSWDIPDDGYCTSFGAHPHDSVYISFFEEYIYKKIKFLDNQLTFDYTDRWSESKHNAIRKEYKLL